MDATGSVEISFKRHFYQILNQTMYNYNGKFHFRVFNSRRFASEIILCW